MSQSNLDVIFTAPHPDDIEISMGGTVAQLVSLGYKVGLVHMTDGEPTPRGTKETRLAELHAAAEVLGVTTCDVLGLTNRELMDGPAARYALATMIRKYRPRILVGMAGRTPAASPDHYQGQLITEGARFYSQLTKWDDRFDNTKPFRVDHLIYRPIPFSAEITHWPSRFVVDITNTLETKIDALRCYKSQFDDTRFERLEHHVRSTAGAEGSYAGVRAGELFAIPRPILTADPVALFGDWQIPPPFASEKEDSSGD